MKRDGLSAFLVIKIILSFFLFLVDVLICVRLLVEGHLTWGFLTLTWILTGLCSTLLCVTIGRFRNGDSMSCPKFLVLCLKVYAELVGAFSHSGPQIITQLAIFWTGVYVHSDQLYRTPGSWDWGFAWLQIASPILNFISLVMTGAAYCREPEPLLRKLCSHLSILTTLLYRLFIFSFIFLLSPIISTSVVALLYLMSAVFYRLCGDGVQCIVLGYFTLYLPCAHTNQQGGKPGYIPTNAGLPELERSRINHEALLVRVRKCIIAQIFISIVLLVPYVVFVEVWLFSPEQDHQIAEIFRTRLFLYLAGLLLLLMSLLSYIAFYIQCRKARDAARTWTGLAPALLSPASVVDPNSLQPEPLTGLRPATPTALQPAYVPTRPMSGAGDLYHYLPTAPELGGTVYPPEEPRSEGTFPRSKPLPPGGRKCQNDECVTCAWLIEGPHFSSTVTQKQYRFMPPVSCRDTNLIYLVTCRRCRKQYVGKTQQSLRERHYGHRREIDTMSSPLGKHFAEVCGIESWRLQIIDKCPSTELRRREAHWMHELSSLSPVGLNIRDEAGGDGH